MDRYDMAEMELRRGKELLMIDQTGTKLSVSAIVSLLSQWDSLVGPVGWTAIQDSRPFISPKFLLIPPRDHIWKRNCRQCRLIDKTANRNRRLYGWKIALQKQTAVVTVGENIHYDSYNPY